jgi:hypothetical protein
MKLGRVLSLVTIAAISTACASAENEPKAGANEGAPFSSAASETAGALPNAALPSGACGMILWTLDVERPIPVFRAVSEKGAEVNVDGAVRKLALTEFGGGSGFGVFESQTFAGEGLKVTVRVSFGLGFEGGSYLDRGLISIEKPNGWKAVIPAAGIAGCRAK